MGGGCSGRQAQAEIPAPTLIGCMTLASDRFPEPVSFSSESQLIPTLPVSLGMITTVVKHHLLCARHVLSIGGRFLIPYSHSNPTSIQAAWLRPGAL